MEHLPTQHEPILFVRRSGSEAEHAWTSMLLYPHYADFSLDPEMGLIPQSWTGWSGESRIVCRRRLIGTTANRRPYGNPELWVQEAVRRYEENLIRVSFEIETQIWPDSPFFVVPSRTATCQVEIELELLVRSVSDLPQLEGARSYAQKNPGMSIVNRALNIARRSTLGEGHWLPIVTYEGSRIIYGAIEICCGIRENVHHAVMYLAGDVAPSKPGQKLLCRSAWFSGEGYAEMEMEVGVIR